MHWKWQYPSNFVEILEKTGFSLLKPTTGMAILNIMDIVFVWFSNFYKQPLYDFWMWLALSASKNALKVIKSFKFRWFSKNRKLQDDESKTYYRNDDSQHYGDHICLVQKLLQIFAVRFLCVIGSKCFKNAPEEDNVLQNRRESGKLN